MNSAGRGTAHPVSVRTHSADWFMLTAMHNSNDDVIARLRRSLSRGGVYEYGNGDSYVRISVSAIGIDDATVSISFCEGDVVVPPPPPPAAGCDLLLQKFPSLWRKSTSVDGVCAASKIDPEGGSQWKCHQAISYTEAADACAANGARLCSVQELATNVAQGTSRTFLTNTVH